MGVGTLIYGVPVWALGAYIVWTEWLKPYIDNNNKKTKK